MGTDGDGGRIKGESSPASVDWDMTNGEGDVGREETGDVLPAEDDIVSSSKKSIC